MISPKEFVHLAGKSTLKDWKRAIRMNGIMLRWALAPGSASLVEGALATLAFLWGFEILKMRRVLDVVSADNLPGDCTCSHPKH